jgi:tetratricopeptide (TPR) repeat protein
VPELAPPVPELAPPVPERDPAPLQSKPKAGHANLDARAMPGPSTETQAEAQRHLVAAEKHYRRGRYDAAEAALKEALALYPFLPRVSLLLGKIYLIRGSSARDEALLASARLMFEMAAAQDQELREAVLLLQLFREPVE